MTTSAPKRRGRIVAGTAAAVFVAAGALAPATAQEEAPIVVARINSTEITKSMLDLAIEEYADALTQYPEEYYYQLVLGPLLDIALLADAAKTEGLEANPIYRERLQYLMLQALYQTYYEVVVVGGITDEEIRAVYDEELAAFVPQEETRAQHILVATEAEAREVIAQLGMGVPFENLARDFSTDTGSAAAGGDLGYFTRDMMVTSFADAAFATAVGETSAPVQSEFGWHVIRVLDRRMTEPLSYEEVEDPIRQYLAEGKLEEVLNDLAEAADYEVFLERVDPNYAAQLEAQAAAAGAAAAVTPAPAQ